MDEIEKWSWPNPGHRPMLRIEEGSPNKNDFSPIGLGKILLFLLRLLSLLRIPIQDDPTKRLRLEFSSQLIPLQPSNIYSQESNTYLAKTLSS